MIYHTHGAKDYTRVCIAKFIFLITIKNIYFNIITLRYLINKPKIQSDLV